MIEATPELEIYISRGIRQDYEDILMDYLWRLSVTQPILTPDQEGFSDVNIQYNTVEENYGKGEQP